jgi:hypothetical protein
MIAVPALLYRAPAAYPTHLSCMGILLLHSGIIHYANILKHTKVKQGPALATSLVDNKLVKGVMVWQYEILLQRASNTFRAT